MKKHISYIFIFLLTKSFVGLSQSDTALINKKINHASYWFSSYHLKELIKRANQTKLHKLSVDSFNIYFKETFNDYADILDSIEAEERKHQTTVTISNYFTTNVNYKGRIIDENQFGNTPSILLEMPIGINLYAAENYWSQEKKPFALTELGIGYEKEFLDYFTIGADYERWIFTNGTKKERKYLTNFGAAYLNFESEHIYANAMYSYVWGTAHASAINLDFAYIKKFNFVKKLRCIEFKPTFTFIAGNPNYTLGNVKSAKAGQSISNTTSIAKDNSFTALDYETSLAITTRWKKFKLIAEQHFAFPVNGTSDIPAYNFNYFTLQLDYIFGLK